MGSTVVSKKRIPYIDCLKGFATILVVIGHVFDGYLHAGLFADNRDIMSSGYNIIYAFHMALFFMISGFVFVKAYIKNGEVKPSLKKQIWNIAAVYVIFSVLFGLFKFCLGKYTNGDVELFDLLMIPVKPIYPYWYLYLMIAYYLIFRIKAIYKANPFPILIVLMIISFFSNFIPNDVGKFFEVKHFLYYLFFFAFGVVLSAHEESYRKHEPLIAIPLFVVSMILILIAPVGYTYEDFDKGKLFSCEKWNFAIAIGICLILFYLFRLLFSNENHIHVRLMSKLGQYSLEIYVLHCIFTAGNRVVLSKLHIHQFYLNIIMNVMISVAIPVIFAVICKKLDVHKYIFRPIYAIADRKKNENEI